MTTTTRIVLFCIVAPLCMGQMCGSPAVPDLTDPNRLEVTDDLRTACPGISDASIETLISAAEEDRLAGFPRQTLLDGLQEACSSTGHPQNCIDCNTAIINQVHGE